MATGSRLETLGHFRRMNDMRMPSLARLRQHIAFWALAGAVLLVSHDAVFLAQLGPGEPLASALRQASHEYWGTASLAIGAIGLLAALAVILRILRLHRRASELGARPVRVARPGYLRRVARTWSALFAVVAFGFLVQENVEHAAGHGHLPGTGALFGPEYPLALPVIALITLVGALLGAAAERTERALATAIEQVLRLILRPPRRLLRAPMRAESHPQRALAGDRAGRAPPSPLASFI